MMETKRSSLCIRYNNCTIWITSGEISEKVDVNLNFSIIDTISYWLAECKGIIENMELMDTLLSIGEMAKLNNVNIQTLRFYCNKELVDAHSAEADTRATYEVLKSQLQYYPDLVNDVETLSKDYGSFKNNVDFAGRIVYDDNQTEVFNFGKHKGKPVADILKREPSYYSWMMDGDFPLNTKQVLTKIRLRELGQ